MSSAGFYRAFEERFYAPREIIKGLRQQYLPFVEPLAALYPGAMAFDIGCGRGEWLEILLELGLSPFGMDLDEGMLQGCVDLSLPAAQGDAVAHLATLADQSQAVITAFHVVEHVSFKQLQTIIKEAKRALKPGGLLIMETPNPENMVVATHDFYQDPTHQRPIPSSVLVFLTEFHGYGRAATLRLQENGDLRHRTDVSLMDVLGGVSPDYAVVAQKEAEPEIMARFDVAFSARYGIELGDLANRYDAKHDARMTAINNRLDEAETRYTNQMAELIERAELANTRAREVETRYTNQMAELIERAELADTRAREAEACAANLGVECINLRNSWSWRITAPFRSSAGLVMHPGDTLRNGVNHTIHWAVETFQRPLSWLMAAVLQRPQLSRRGSQFLTRYPALRQQLWGVARRQGVVQGAMDYRAFTGASPEKIYPALNHLTPHARKVFADLKVAMQNSKRND